MGGAESKSKKWENALNAARKNLKYKRKASVDSVTSKHSENQADAKPLAIISEGEVYQDKENATFSEKLKEWEERPQTIRPQVISTNEDYVRSEPPLPPHSSGRAFELSEIGESDKVNDLEFKPEEGKSSNQPMGCDEIVNKPVDLAFLERKQCFCPESSHLIPENPEIKDNTSGKGIVSTYSSEDDSEIFTDAVASPLFSLEGSYHSADNEEITVNGTMSTMNKSAFTITRHRKIEVPALESNELQIQHSPIQLESNVLKKVASLTLDNALVDSRAVGESKPKKPPEKLQFQTCDKFEGQMLVNWFLSSFPEDNHTLKMIANQFCSHLLSAGVIQEISDKNLEASNHFKVDRMYFWSKSETPVATGQYSPGKISLTSWPPACELGNNNNIVLSDTLSYDALENVKLEREIEHLKSEIEKLKAQVEKEKQTKLHTCPGSTDLIRPSHLDLSPKTKRLPLTPSRIPSSKLKSPPKTSQPSPEKKTQSSPLRTPQCSPSKSSSPGRGKAHTKLSLKSTPPRTASSPVHKSKSSDSIAPSCREQSCQTSPCQALSKSFESHLTCDLDDSQLISDLDKKVHYIVPLSQVPSQDKLSLTQKNPSSPVPKCSLEGNVPPPPPPPPMEGLCPPCISNIPPPPPPPMEGIFPPCISHIPPPPPPPIGGIPTPPPLSNIPPPPPPPPSIGSIPPPPPLAGYIPPPPPPMGNIPPPPPPMGNIPPPPPPMGSIPSPPQMNGTSSGTSPTSGAPSISPLLSAGPTPFPTPPVGGWNANRDTFRKQPVNPPKPMKPLYWTRLIVPPEVPSDTTPLWKELEEVPIQNLDEFTELFSRQVAVARPMSRKQTRKISKVQNVARLIDGKRSQNVGILAQSLHTEFSEIEAAIFNMDTSVVSLEALQQIYDARATEEEIALIRAHLASNPDLPLDKPEQFLADLADIPHFSERIACFMFEADFSDSISLIECKLNNIKSVCQFLMKSEDLKKVIAIILSLGNFMNGGNRLRGQADGFGLEILPKLKDVKSKDNSLTLLHFIVRTYLRGCEAPLTAALPVPEPGDIDRACSLVFDDVHAQLTCLAKKLDAVSNSMTRVIRESKPEHLEPFRSKMESCTKTAKNALSEQLENMEDANKRFKAVLKFYQYIPKGVPANEVTPKDLFVLWAPFCHDFKDAWKKEQDRIMKEKVKEMKKKQEDRKQQVQKMKKQETGLKARFQRMERLQDFNNI